MLAFSSAAPTALSPGTAEIVTPGEKLGSIDAYQPGSGTHVMQGNIYAAITGFKHQQQTAVTNTKPTLSVSSNKPPALVPQSGDIVTARVVKINPRYATCSILCIGPALLPSPFPAIIRQRDIRSFDIDNAEMIKAFRPGDLIIASVLSLGDARSYYLSTAGADQGVVEAVSAAGGDMAPVSWERMQCKVTGMKEYRKVAKVAETTQSASLQSTT